MATMDQTPDTPAEATGAPAEPRGSASPFGMFSEDQAAQPDPPAAAKAPARRTRKTAVKSSGAAGDDAAASDDGADSADSAPIGAGDGPEGEDATPAGAGRKSAAKKTTARKTAAKKTTAKKATTAKKVTTAATRKTATRKSAPAAEPEPGPADAPVEEPADGAPTDAPTDDIETPSTQPSDRADEAVAEAPVDGAHTDPTDAGTADAATGQPEEDADEGQSEEEAAAEQRPGTPGSPFGLLFQAPDLSAVATRQPRTRRAEPARAESARAGSANAGSAHAESARVDAPPVADPQHDGPDTDTTAADRSDGPTRTTRGRGSRRPSRAGQVEGQGTGPQDTSVPATGDEGQADETSPGESGDDQGDDFESANARRRRRRGGKGRRGRGTGPEDTGDGDPQDDQDEPADETEGDGAAQPEGESTKSTVRRRRRSNRRGEDTEAGESRRAHEEVTGVRGSTRLEAKRQRRREGREAGRRRSIITEAEFLARRESVERTMVVRGLEDRTQIGVLEDGVLVEHYVSRETQTTMVGNVYLGRVQNVLPSMEAAFVDIGKGRNAVLYAGEVNWDAAGLDSNQPKRIENALKSGDSVLVQVTKDPIGHKGARLTSQVSLPGRYLVLVPGNSMTGISRKLPDTERARLRRILKEVVPEGAGVIVRTAAEGASEEELRADVERLTGLWQRIESKQKSANAPALVHGEPDMTVRVIRDVFNEDFAKVVVSGERAWAEVSDYIGSVAPDLAERLEKWTGTQDVFTHYRVTEALAKAMDRKVWLPSGGSLVIDRTEAMTVVDVNTGKFVGSGGNLEETVTKNNIEAAEEIVRQLRLRDIGGIIVIDFIDMVLESNRDLVVRRLLECLGRDRTKHQVAEVTSLGLVQMTRKRVGAGLIEVFSEPCVHCSGRGIVVHAEPVEKSDSGGHGGGSSGGGRRGRGRSNAQSSEGTVLTRPTPAPGGPTPAQIAAAAHAAAIASTTQSSAKTAQSAHRTGDDPARRPDVASAAARPDADAGRRQRGTQSADPSPGLSPDAQSTQSPASQVGEPQTTTPPEASGQPQAGEVPAATARTEPTAATAPAAPATAGIPSTPETSESAPRPRSSRRASRRAQSAPTAPPAAELAVPPAPQTRPAGAGAEDMASTAVRSGTGTGTGTEVEPVRAGVDEPAENAPVVVAPARRRGRGRVVAPAGPPTSGPESG